jgi:uncharacterized protein (DUF1330 family)
MPAYLIADVEITDPVRYEDYRAMVPAALEGSGGHFIVRGGRSEVLEGEWQPNRLVILEFDTLERARAWWASEQYRAAKELRQQTAISNVIIVEGVAMPHPA